MLKNFFNYLINSLKIVKFNIGNYGFTFSIYKRALASKPFSFFIFIKSIYSFTMRLILLAQVCLIVYCYLFAISIPDIVAVIYASTLLFTDNLISNINIYLDNFSSIFTSNKNVDSNVDIVKKEITEIKDDIKNTRFTVIHKIPNFKFIYKLEHPNLYINLSAGQIEILEAFSLFSIRTLEQLLIDAYPENNLNTRQVYHTYNWDSSKLNKKVSEVYGSNPINVIIFKENEIISSISYNSHSEAKRALGVKTRSLRPYINNTKSYYSLLRIRY